MNREQKIKALRAVLRGEKCIHDAFVLNPIISIILEDDDSERPLFDTLTGQRWNESEYDAYCKRYNIIRVDL